MSSILFNICDLGPPEKEPSTTIDKLGSVTSSIKYNNLKLGKAIRINIKAGVIVHINSINVKKKWTSSSRTSRVSRIVSEDPTSNLNYY